MPGNKTPTTLSKTPTPAPSRFRQLLANLALHEAIDWIREHRDWILELIFGA